MPADDRLPRLTGQPLIALRRSWPPNGYSFHLKVNGRQKPLALANPSDFENCTAARRSSQSGGQSLFCCWDPDKGRPWESG